MRVVADREGSRPQRFDRIERRLQIVTAEIARRERLWEEAIEGIEFDSGRQVASMRASEFRLHALAAAELGVPVVFVSGDEGLCAEVAAFASGIRTVATGVGFGASMRSEHPDMVLPAIAEGVAAAIGSDRGACLVTAPKGPVVEVVYKDQALAYRKGFYPGAELVAPNCVRFAAASVFEVMRFLNFVT